MSSQTSKIRFIYFDFGKVLVDFDYGQMLRQIAEVTHLEPDFIEKILLRNGLQKQYETGQLTTEAFYELFCKQTGTRVEFETLLEASSAFFELNDPIMPVLVQLREAGHRLGVLSNTCPSHWNYCVARYPMLEEFFESFVLSYEVKASKPDPKIYRAAAELSGVEPREIFFTDDIQENVDGAIAAGFDAVQFTSPERLVEQLRQRGLLCQ